MFVAYKIHLSRSAYMVLRFFMLAVAFLLSCTDVKRDDPDDPKSKYYNSGNVSSSSSEDETVSSSSENETPSSSSQSKGIPGPSVSYEGGTYNSVVIGTQTWMSRNLNYAVPGSKCGKGSELVDKNTEICDTYGRFYEWKTAMALDSICEFTSCASKIKPKHQGICPDGWHIPSNSDWNTLLRYVDLNAGTKLKADVGWNTFGTTAARGTDNFGFYALPGGWGGPPLQYIGNRGYWWSATEEHSSDDASYWVNDWVYMMISATAYYWLMENDSPVLTREYTGKNLFLSVRCLKD